MRGHIYMATKPYPHREQLKKELIKMLLKKQEALIKKIKPEKDLDDRYDLEGVWGLPHEEMSHPPKPKLWYLIAVLKKVGISLEQVGDEMGLTFLGNVICQFKQVNLRSCNYVCFLHNYFQKVSTRDWPAKNAILKKLMKRLPKMRQTRNKADKSFNEWWKEEMLKQIIYYRYQVSATELLPTAIKQQLT